MTDPTLRLWFYRHQLRAQTRRILARLAARREAAE